MEDRQFLLRCLQGDKPAWDEFTDKYSRLIYNYIYSVLKTKGLIIAKDNIEDLFQGIFLLLYSDNFKKLRSFRGSNGCTLASWLRQIVINYTIDYLRKLKPLVSLEEEDENHFSLKELLIDDSALASDRLVQQDKLDVLKECLEKLRLKDKYFLELHFQRQVSLEGMKKLLRTSRAAVDMRKLKIMRALRRCFQKKGFRLDS